MIRRIQKVLGVRSIQHIHRSYTMGKTDCKAQDLPRLPVPKLEDTLAKFLKTARPHLNDQEFKATSKLVAEFGSGIGSKLQRLLELRAQSLPNWLEEWWLKLAYMEYRDPVVVYSSPGLVFPMREYSCQTDQYRVAAKTLRAAMDYKKLIDENQLPIDRVGKNPLDMQQYKKIFGTCRIPGLERDSLSYNSDSKYVIVMHNQHMYRVDLWGEDNVMVSEDQLVEQLIKVVECSLKRSEQPIGILTSDNRDNWAKAYNILIKDPFNKDTLEIIERSLCLLCLDAAAGVAGADGDARRNIAAEQTIHGRGSASNGGNRWFDKTIQFIVGADGVTGLTYEHSPAEGQPIASMADYIVNYIDKNAKGDPTPSQSPKEPKLLSFNVNAEIDECLKTAAINLDKLVADLELNCFQFDRYGKNFIKSQKVSPDSYLQMAMQFAFYRLHQTPGAHYESAATRMYIGGRTETIRSCSIESIDFAQAMLNPKTSSKERLVALKKAIQGHKDYTVQAMQGLGVDRHLLGLKQAAIENGMTVPELYSDPGVKRSAHMRISTSQVACKCDGFMCYGPLVADGYATCYNPRDNDVNIATSAFRAHRDTACGPYRAALEQSLQDMHDLFAQNVQSKL